MIAADPAVAAGSAAIVKTELPEAEIVALLNDPAIPSGRPEAVRTISPLNPAMGATETLMELDPPAPTATEAGEAENWKSGTGCEEEILILIAAVCEIAPAVPVTVTVELPGLADGSTVIVAVLDEPGATGLGAKATPIPCGVPEANNDTDGPALPTALTERVAVPEEPALIDNEPGEGAKEKSDPGLKSISVTGCSSIPLGATPRCPWRKSNIPMPVIRTGTLTS